MPQRVRAVDNGDDPLRTGQAGQPLHREELGRQVGNVSEMKDFRPRRDRLLEPLVEIILRRRHRKLESCHLDALPPHPLIPRRQHAGIILLGCNDLIASLEVDPVLDDLERLAGTASQGQLVRIASEFGRHPQADRLYIPRDHPLVMDGQHVDHVHVAPGRFEGNAWGGTGEAVIEVDERPVQLEGQLNLAPEELVFGDFLGRLIRERLDRSLDALQRIGLENRGRRSDGGARMEKRPSTPHSRFHSRPPQNSDSLE
jgi:hypothetical protein